MDDICCDNRFELIEKYKKKLIEATNIETSPDEMKVLDNILFRFWQMGWLDKLELPSEQPSRGYIEQIKWERDIAIQQLADLGYGFGEKPRTNDDTISRQAAIDVLSLGKEIFSRVLDDTDVVGTDREKYSWGLRLIESNIKDIEELPSAQPTLYGYNIEHLKLIAKILQKEDLPPERAAEVLTDIGRIVAIVRDEFEETLRRSVRNIERRTYEGNVQDK